MIHIHYEGKIPSINNYYHRLKNRVVLSDVGREFKSKISSMVPETNEHMDAYFRVIIRVSFARAGRDVDNVLKPILDSVQGKIYKNDSQVIELKIVKDVICKKDKLSVEFIPLIF